MQVLRASPFLHTRHTNAGEFLTLRAEVVRKVRTEAAVFRQFLATVLTIPLLEGILAALIAYKHSVSNQLYAPWYRVTSTGWLSARFIFFEQAFYF